MCKFALVHPPSAYASQQCMQCMRWRPPQAIPSLPSAPRLKNLSQQLHSTHPTLNRSWQCPTTSYAGTPVRARRMQHCITHTIPHSIVYTHQVKHGQDNAMGLYFLHISTPTPPDPVSVADQTAWVHAHYTTTGTGPLAATGLLSVQQTGQPCRPDDRCTAVTISLQPTPENSS